MFSEDCTVYRQTQEGLLTAISRHHTVALTRIMASWPHHELTTLLGWSRSFMPALSSVISGRLSCVLGLAQPYFAYHPIALSDGLRPQRPNSESDMLNATDCLLTCVDFGGDFRRNHSRMMCWENEGSRRQSCGQESCNAYVAPVCILSTDDAATARNSTPCLISGRKRDRGMHINIPPVTLE